MLAGRRYFLFAIGPKVDYSTIVLIIFVFESSMILEDYNGVASPMNLDGTLIFGNRQAAIVASYSDDATVILNLHEIVFAC